MKITTLFLDIGGVLLTNGWDHHSRMRAAAHFSFDFDEMEKRHTTFFELFELDKLSLKEYLERVVFYKKRTFSIGDFKKWMFAESQPFDDMIELISSMKKKFDLQIVVVSNESRELNEYRIKKFKLGSFVDFFISSCFVQLRKPDVDIYRMALAIAQVTPEEVLYIEDRALFIEVATELGIKGILHTDYASTKKALQNALQ